MTTRTKNSIQSFFNIIYIYHYKIMKIDSKLQDIFLAKFVYRREFDNRAVILEKNKKNSSPCGYSSNF